MGTHEAVVMGSPAVQHFLRSLQSGNWDGYEALLSDDVAYDASVPGWRYVRYGREAVVRELREEWTRTHAWSIAEIRAATLPDGELVEVELRGRCPGDEDHESHEEACRMANVFRLVEGRIAEHRVYCCGEWDEETMQRIESELERTTSVDGRRTE